MLQDYGIALTRSEVAIEASQCGQFEADRFGIDVHAPVFLVLCRELHQTGGHEAPLEVARVEYRGNQPVPPRSRVAESHSELAATLALSDEAGGAGHQ